ncbi:MAG: HlyD family type I secretion periplasmic adaptor subunit [Oculatellaceae cyanobacterium Prado106]|jgi:HlyD family type I secretion membrane fusion protein|nr:HlyD family type I secretion periplasmic adaptor subunit [Oculatellaceae cyanobacterium Prado106]
MSYRASCPQRLSSSQTHLDPLEIALLTGHESAEIKGGAMPLEQPSPGDYSVAKIAPHRTSVAPHWSHSVQSLLDQPPSTLPLWLAVGGLVFSGVFTSWAWFGQIQEVSHAEGKLIPKGEVYKIQPVVQGRIDQIFVKEGQTVKAGQVMATLDDRLAINEIQQLEQSLTAYHFQINQIQNLMTQVQLEGATRQAIASAESRAQEAAIVQAQANITTHQNLQSQFRTEEDAYQVRLARVKPLVQEGAISIDHLFGIEQSIREHGRTVTQNQGELQRNLAEVNQLQAVLAQKQAEGQQSQLQTQQRLQELATQLSQQQAKIQETQNALKASQTRLSQMQLLAPVSGLISTLKVRNSGEVTQPGQTFAEIAPENTPLILSALLPNQEAGLVKLGMQVQVKLDAFPYQDYGTILGKVTAIAPDAQSHEKFGLVYPIEITLDRTTMRDQQQSIRLKAGQTAQADIITRQRRILDILLDPIRKIQQDGIKL